MKKKVAVIVAIALAGTMFALPGTGHAWGGGWGWGPGFFAGGVLLGAALTAPRYYYPPPPVYVYPEPQVVYTAPPPPPAYAYPSPAPQSSASAAQQGPGHWVQVPGQMVADTWVPPHKVWVPDAAQPANPSNSGGGQQQ